MTHYLLWPFYQHDWLLSSLLPALVNHPQTIDLWWQEMRSTNAFVMMQVRLYKLSTPVIKLSISISKQSKGISSLLKQLVSNRKRRYLFHKFIDYPVTAHIPLNRDDWTFCIRTSCERTDGLKLSHTAWLTRTFVRLSQFSGRWYLFILSWSFSSGSPSFISVSIMLASSVSTFGPVSSFCKSCSSYYAFDVFPHER